MHLQEPAAASDIIVISHIDIKHQLLLQGLKASRLHCVVLAGLSVTETDTNKVYILHTFHTSGASDHISAVSNFVHVLTLWL